MMFHISSTYTLSKVAQRCNEIELTIFCKIVMLFSYNKDGLVVFFVLSWVFIVVFKCFCIY